ncbi:hypothetical protein QR98_0091420 [Sarcoptes scabiei]|uniref:Uncharacterized protein n=1 Tax=Sarcoptes scabiei TaxID=52283 RepID=A0A132AI39_SARSC|nr:hypothetical protein QR98_0091420 [Sarcoptes scabiei]
MVKHHHYHQCHIQTISILLLLSIFNILAVERDDRFVTNQYLSPSQSTRNNWREEITDFRYNSSRIDGITNLRNGSLIVISNNYYWILEPKQKPTINNVRGGIQNLWKDFTTIDDIWIDPYNEISPQLYIASNTAERGLEVVCQEFEENFVNDSSFCHLPVDKTWYIALRDLDRTKPINAVTWRNRTKNQDGGFWVFFQQFQMITIDPYEMNLRYTYDIRQWMSINETITAAFFDYHQSVYHFFFENNRYRKWTVNVPYMNSLPMTWDRAFLHGKLSEEMKINKDFFGFSQSEIIDRPQPWRSIHRDANLSPKIKIKSSIRTKNGKDKDSFETRSSHNLSDNKVQFDVKHEKISESNSASELEGNKKTIHKNEEDTEKEIQINSINYHKRLMRFDAEDVRDFSSKKLDVFKIEINATSKTFIVPNQKKLMRENQVFN